VIERARPRPRRRRPSRRPRLLLLAAALVVVFGLGVAFGQALQDNPAPGGTQTGVRTLKPLQLAPAARSTVTVTVSTP
jgi:ferric-dicitrate binding protein FerR (iron transport regulator)